MPNLGQDWRALPPGRAAGLSAAVDQTVCWSQVTIPDDAVANGDLDSPTSTWACVVSLCGSRAAQRSFATFELCCAASLAGYSCLPRVLLCPVLFEIACVLRRRFALLMRLAEADALCDDCSHAWRRAAVRFPIDEANE